MVGDFNRATGLGAPGWVRSAALGLATFVLVALALGATGWRSGTMAQTASEDQGVLAGFISRVLSTPTSQVSIGSIEGALSSDATIRSITVADAAGVYLAIDRIRINWRRTALLQRRIEIEQLDIGQVTWSRRPQPVAGVAATGPILPELPLSVEVGALTLSELVLGELVLGTSARVSANGSASLGAPAQGLRARFAVRRLDAAGSADLALSFVPENERLDLILRHQEPAGGLLARAAGIPGLPPVSLDLTGAGTLDDWRARLAFEGGPELGAGGEARLAREGAARRLTLNLDARIAPLLPPVVSPIFAGSTRLEGNVAFHDGAAMSVSSIRLSSALAQLNLEGSITAERELDLSARARAVADAGGLASIGVGSLERLNFDGAVKGPMNAPRINGMLDLAGLRTPDLTIGAIQARFSAAPASAAPGLAPNNAAASRFGLEADASVRGLVPADAALARALGQDITLTVRGTLDGAGVAELQTASLASPHFTLSYAGRLGRQLVDGTLATDLLRLEAFSGVARRDLSGRARVDADISGDPSSLQLSARLRGQATALSLGDARLDRLLGRRLSLDGGLALRDGALRFNDVALAADALTARLNGTASLADVSLEAQVALADLARLDARLGGRATLTFGLTGPASDPSATVDLAAGEAQALGQPVRGLTARVNAQRTLTAPDVSASATGMVGGKSLAVNARLRGEPAAGNAARAWTIDALAATLGSVAVQGQGGFDADGFADGRFTVEAQDLADASPLALRPLAGRLTAMVVAEAPLAEGIRRQGFSIRATGERLAIDALRAESLSADLVATDVRNRPRLRGQARIAGLIAGGERFDSLSLTASEARAGASAIVLEGRARGFDLDAAALVEPLEPVRIRLDRFRAARAGRSIALADAATLDVVGGGFRTGGITLDVAGGRVTLAGLISAERLDATLAARALPLSATDIVMPGLGLSGTIDASATLGGTLARPQGQFEITARSIGAPVLRNAGIPALALTARGRLDGERAILDAALTGGRAIDLRVEGRLPLSPTGRFDLTARGTLDAALANTRLAGAGQRLAGRINLDARIAGTAGSPDIGGSASISGGSFTDAAQGIALNGIAGRIVGRGESLQIESLTARTAGNGTLGLSGRVTADPGRGFPAELRLTGRNAELLESDLARLVANLDLAISGPLASAPRIGGRVGVVSLDVRVPERLGGASAPLRDARHIAPPPQTRARLAQIARTNAGVRRAGAPFRAALDITIYAPSRIFLRGRGLDAELGGTLRLTGTTLQPEARGGFELRRGRLTILTQRLDFSRGRLTFGGTGLVPELDLVAETRAGDVTARVAVTGPADTPEFAFSSTPALPEDEVLSRLLFARAAGGLSPFQAIQLAQAVAQLSGAGGPDVFEDTRRALGVDDLDIGFGEGGPTVGISRAISKRVRIGVRAGARPESTGVGVDIDLTRRLRLQSEVGADGRAAVGIGIEQEY